MCEEHTTMIPESGPLTIRPRNLPFTFKYNQDLISSCNTGRGTDNISYLLYLQHKDSSDVSSSSCVWQIAQL